MREVFASDNFELKDFLASHKDVPIEDLIKDLEDTSQIVQNELFELINGDLVHFQEVLKEVCKGNLEVIKQFRQSYESEVKFKENNYLNYMKYYEEASAKYQKLKYVQKKRDLSLRLLKARQYIKTFIERNHLAEKSIYELEISVKNYSWLSKFTTEFANDLEAEGDLLIEMSQFSERLQEIIEIHLKNYLSSFQETIGAEKMEIEVCLLLTLCEEMKMINLFEASFKLTILYPKLEYFFDSSFDPSSIFNFKKFINNVLTFINLLKTNWNRNINKFYKEEHKFWTRTVLGPTLAWIIEKCSNINGGISIFNPINLEEFKTNFEEGLKFVSRIEEEFFKFEKELLFFRSHAAWIGFMKKWSLHQYYQIRIKQIISPIESVMINENGGVKDHDYEHEKDPQTQVLLDATLVTVNALKHLWTDDVILKPLIPKFLKITLQVFKRFIDYCTEKALNHANPKTFLIIYFKKQYNMEQFILLIEQNVKPNLWKHLNNLEEQEDLCEEILIKLKKEISDSISKSNYLIINEIEKLYDQMINNETDELLFTNINLEALKLLFSSESKIKMETSNQKLQLIQRILLKLNRKIFKLIDENKKEKEIIQFLGKMKEIEVEADELGYSELINEEFWIEIKSSINNLKSK